MENPKTCTKGYRFGFNGMEMDNEVSGAGNSYTAEHWQYDPRLGRRLNTDPVVKIWQSPYAVLSNSPIINVDPLGDDDYYNKAGKYLGSTAEGTAIRVVNKANMSQETFKSMQAAGNIKQVDDLSQQVKIQANQQQAIEALYNNNSSPGAAEKTALIVLDVTNATLSLVEQNSVGNTNNESTTNTVRQPDGINGDYTHVIGDKSKVVVGQLHTHPLNEDGSQPAPKVSEEGGLGVNSGSSDVTAAKNLQVPVIAVDKNNLHKVSANGEIKNNLPKNTEVLKSSLEESGGKK